MVVSLQNRLILQLPLTGYLVFSPLVLLVVLLVVLVRVGLLFVRY